MLKSKQERLNQRLNEVEKALSVVNRCETNELTPDEGIVIQSMNLMIESLKGTLMNISDPEQRMSALRTYDIINEIYFDKLEKEINTKH